MSEREKEYDNEDRVPRNGNKRYKVLASGMITGIAYIYATCDEEAQEIADALESHEFEWDTDVDINETEIELD